jgi:predicted RNA methylase
MLQNTGLHRDDMFDKYYTKPTVSKQLVSRIQKYVKINKNDIIIEPSAGSGSFIPFLEHVTNNVRFYDIAPEHTKIKKQNFLTLNTRILGKDNIIHVIGNPPYGRQSKLAKAFIKKAVLFADSISFILPMSFKKPTLHKVFPLNWHLRYSYDLPNNSFTVNKNELDVPSVFQIWTKEATDRKVPKVFKPVGFSFVKKNQKPSFSMRRIGFYAGKVDKRVVDKSEESHYFIKVIGGRDKVKIIFNIFAEISFSHKNTVGPRSISKQEIFNKLPNNMRTI